jgi:phage gpG-like protein
VALRLDIRANGVKQTTRKLHDVATRLVDAAPGLEAVAERFNEIAKGEFDSQGKNFGGWDALAPSTLEDRARKGYASGPILVRSGELERGLTETMDPAHIVEVLPQMLKWGSTTPYGGWHMTGTRNMSARPPFRASELDKRTVVAILKRYAVVGVPGV